MKIKIVDIETIPEQACTVKPEFDPSSVKHGNTKDPDKRQAKEDKERTAFEDSLTKKMSLHPDLCEVVCVVGMLFDTSSKETTETIMIGEESSIIESAWGFIGEPRVDCPLVTFNGIGFDLPVLFHRAMSLGIPVKGTAYRELTSSSRYHPSTLHYDIMQIMAGWDKQRWESLNFYLKKFGLPEKTQQGGAVFEMWKKGEVDAIAEYCKHDVLSTANLFARLEDWIA